jgi:hypothetical protein
MPFYACFEASNTEACTRAPAVLDDCVITLSVAFKQVNIHKSFKFLGVHITNELSWSKHAKAVVKRALQNLFPLKTLKRFGMGHQVLKR